MISVDHLLCHGKRLTVLRLVMGTELGTSYYRPPAQRPTDFCLEIMNRWFASLDNI